MSKGQKLRALVNERLTAAAAEIFELFERTIAEYEQEVLLLTQRNHKQLLLDCVLNPEVVLHRVDIQILSLESQRDTKEEPELCIKQEPEEFPFHMVSVKTEDDEDKSSVLHQRATEENREETNGEDCGAEAGCSSDPLTQLHSDSEEHTDSSSDTDHSEDYSQEQAPSKRSYAMISPDSSVTDAKPYRCSDCGKGFTRNQELKRHMSVHTGERPFKCSVCEKSFKRKSHLVTHLRIHIRDKPFKCSVCEKGFKQKADFTQHLKCLHRICPVCEKHFKNKNKLWEHLRTHAEDGTLNPDSSVTDVGATDRPYSCSECGKRFKFNSFLQKHASVHTEESPHRCSVCEKCFKQKSSLSRHLGVRHCICSVCEEGFENNTDLKLHLRTHAQDRTGPDLDQSSVVNPDSFGTDVEGNPKPLRCSKCGKAFLKKLNLVRHMIVHTGQSFFECPVCQRGFVSQRDLRMHRGIHTGEKKFSCSVCEKGFVRKRPLEVHMRVHTGEKPYCCPACDKRFTQQGHLKAHLKTQHKGSQTE